MSRQVEVSWVSHVPRQVPGRLPKFAISVEVTWRSHALRQVPGGLPNLATSVEVTWFSHAPRQVPRGIPNARRGDNEWMLWHVATTNIVTCGDNGNGIKIWHVRRIMITFDKGGNDETWAKTVLEHQDRCEEGKREKTTRRWQRWRQLSSHPCSHPAAWVLAACYRPENSHIAYAHPWRRLASCIMFAALLAHLLRWLLQTHDDWLKTRPCGSLKVRTPGRCSVRNLKSAPWAVSPFVMFD